MTNRNLSDSGSRPGGIDRDESVHFTVETNVPKYFPAVSFECASIVVKMDAGNQTYESIGDPRRKLLGKEWILPVFAPAADHVKAFLKRIKNLGYVSWVVLQIGVERNDEASKGMIKASCQGGSLSEIPDKLEKTDMLMLVGKLKKHLRTTVTAAVVDKNNLVFVWQTFHDLLERGKEGPQISSFIEDRDNDRNVYHATLLVPRPF